MTTSSFTRIEDLDEYLNQSVKYNDLCMEIDRLRKRAEKQGLKTLANHRDEMRRISNLWGQIPKEELNKRMEKAIKSFRDDIINGE